MATECAACYVSDLNFLLPTLVSATGLRKFVLAHKADVYIFLIDEDDARTKELNRFLNRLRICVMPMDSRSYTGFDVKQFNTSHTFVPMPTLGRFFSGGVLPTSCRRIVYMDGDTWLQRDPSPLIVAIIPDGRFDFPLS